ncbi:MAG: PqqD family protein [Pseudomonadota bacterium]
MDDTTLLRRNASLISTELDGDTVMMDVESGAYFALNGTAGVIWQALEDGATLEKLVSELNARFEVAGGDDIAADVERFLRDMLENGLIETQA